MKRTGFLLFIVKNNFVRVTQKRERRTLLEQREDKNNKLPPSRRIIIMKKYRQAKFLIVVGLIGISLGIGAVEPAEAYVNVSSHVNVRFDAGGFPIWGYAQCGRPIYAYAPDGRPIYLVNGIYSGCFVPTWEPAPYYRGRYYWSNGVCRGHYMPAPPPIPCHHPCYHPSYHGRGHYMPPHPYYGCDRERVRRVGCYYH